MHVGAKSVRDRHERLQKNFNGSDNENSLIPEVDGDLTEAEKHLCLIH